MAESRRGRRRSEVTRRAILEATRDELTAHGYDKLSIDRIAAAAGAGKQTIYRWYPSKSELVADCILEGHVLAEPVAVPDNGDVRRDLRAWLHTFIAYATRPATAALLRAAVAAAAESDAVAARFHERITAVTEATLVGRLRAGAEAGQISAAMPAPAVAQALIGALLYRLLIRMPPTPAFADGLLDVLLAGTNDGPA